VRDLVREAVEGILAHRMRSLLSTLGILFGVAAVIGILSIGEGARREQQSLIEQLGILNFQLRAMELPEDTEARTERLRASRGLSRRDAQALRDGLEDATQIGGMRLLENRELVPVPPDDSAIRVLGAEPSWVAASQLELVEGRPLTEGDEQNRAKVCLIGRSAERALFGPTSGLGQRIRIGPVWLMVVGITQPPGGGTSSAKFEGIELDDRSWDLVVPLATALDRFEFDEQEAELTEIVVALGDASQVPPQSMLARRIVKRLHREQEDVALTVPLELLEQSRAQQRIFNLVMGLIAGISLLVGGIGIMNIMLASVLERTREIGVRLAVGARPADIRMLFLTESAVISLVGGLLGVVVGVMISRGVAGFTGWSTAVSLEAVLLATFVSVAEGVVFGFVPAQRAARLPPVTALRAM
jgi:putative ABC transport system permease protein